MAKAIGFPNHRPGSNVTARPLGARFWFDEFAAEARLKTLGVRALGEAKDNHANVVAAERVAARG